VSVEGLISHPSPYPVGETLDRLESMLRSKGVTVFARIDHAAAAGVGLAMHPAQVLIFGNPKSGTPVMNAAPTIAIDLPFKALAREDAAGPHTSRIAATNSATNRTRPSQSPP